jgi:hypothetical protein
MEKKTCSKCGVSKSIESFFKNRSAKDGLSRTCRECASKRNREIVIPSKKAHRSVGNMKEYVGSIKLRNGCAICGYNKLAGALQFHHVLGEKVGNIANLIANGVIYQIEAELCKCVVLCGNCHAEVHAGLHDTIELMEYVVKIDGVDGAAMERRAKVLKMVSAAG